MQLPRPVQRLPRRFRPVLAAPCRPRLAGGPHRSPTGRPGWPCTAETTHRPAARDRHRRCHLRTLAVTTCSIDQPFDPPGRVGAGQTRASTTKGCGRSPRRALPDKALQGAPPACTSRGGATCAKRRQRVASDRRRRERQPRRYRRLGRAPPRRRRPTGLTSGTRPPALRTARDGRDRAAGEPRGVPRARAHPPRARSARSRPACAARACA